MYEIQSEEMRNYFQRVFSYSVLHYAFDRQGVTHANSYQVKKIKQINRRGHFEPHFTRHFTVHRSRDSFRKKGSHEFLILQSRN